MLTEKDIELSDRINQMTANLKDYQLKKAGLRGREIAREAIGNPITGTAKEINERYPELTDGYFDCVADHEPEDKFLWLVGYSKPTYLRTHKVNISIYPHKPI